MLKLHCYSANLCYFTTKFNSLSENILQTEYVDVIKQLEGISKYCN